MSQILAKGVVVQSLRCAARNSSRYLGHIQILRAIVGNERGLARASCQILQAQASRGFSLGARLLDESANNKRDDDDGPPEKKKESGEAEGLHAFLHI